MLFSYYFSDLPEPLPTRGSCRDIDRRVQVCVPEFQAQGLFGYTGWDAATAYRYKCRTCPQFRHEIGFCFGKGQFTDGFEEKTVFHVRVKNTAELDEATRRMPNARQIFVFSGRKFDFSPMERLTTLEYAVLHMGRGDRLWDMSHTPHLKTLEISLGSAPPDLRELSRSAGLEHLLLSTLVSQINLTVLPDLDFLAGLQSLRTLVLAGVTHEARSIDPLLALPRLTRAWLSPNLFPTEDYARFEALRFKLYEEYGLFRNDDYECALGIGRHPFRSEKARAAFLAEYHALMAACSPELSDRPH